MTLGQFNTRYEAIIHSNLSSNRKAVKLADLMTELEAEFKIPMVRNEKWEQENRAVIALYRKVSMSRDL
jgi:hypothetical protein